MGKRVVGRRREGRRGGNANEAPPPATTSTNMERPPHTTAAASATTDPWAQMGPALPRFTYGPHLIPSSPARVGRAADFARGKCQTRVRVEQLWLFPLSCTS